MAERSCNLTLNAVKNSWKNKKLPNIIISTRISPSKSELLLSINIRRESTNSVEKICMTKCISVVSASIKIRTVINIFLRREGTNSVEKIRMTKCQCSVSLLQIAKNFWLRLNFFQGNFAEHVSKQRPTGMKSAYLIYQSNTLAASNSREGQTLNNGHTRKATFVISNLLTRRHKLSSTLI